MVRYLKLILTISILFTAAPPSFSQDKPMAEREDGIGLVLGGGGAKGFAHIGVLKVLDSLGIKVDYIGGTSIGAIVAGLYAAGYSGIQIEEIARTTDWDKMLTDVVDRKMIPVYEKSFRDRYILSLPVRKEAITTPQGLIHGHNLLNHLTALTSSFNGTMDFSRLPVPYFCIVTDIEAGNEIVVENGILPFVMRASSSIPVLFAPFYLDDKMLVDGGVTNNFPVDRMRERYKGTILGIDLQTGLHEGEDLNSFPALFSQLSTMLDYNNYQKNKGLCDVYVHPDIKGFTLLDFNNITVDSLILRGQRAMIEALPGLDHIIRDTLARVDIKSRLVKNPEGMEYSRAVVHSKGNHDYSYIISMVGIRGDEPTNVSKIRTGVDRLYATGQFNYVTYTLDPANAIVNIFLKEKDEFTLNIGINYEEGNNASVLVNVSSSRILFDRDQLVADFVLAEGPRAAVSYFINRGLRPSPALSFSYTNLRLNYYDDGEKRGYSHSNALSFSAGLQSSLQDKWTWGISLAADYFDYYNVIFALDYLPLEPVPFEDTYYTYKLFLGYDSRNNTILHTAGINVSLSAQVHTDNLSSLAGGTPPVSLSFKHNIAIGSDRTTLLPTLQANLSFGATPLPFHYKSFIGGLYKPYLSESHIPLEGIGYADIIADNAVKAGLELRRRIGSGHYGSVLVNWVAANNSLRDFSDTQNIISYGIRYLAITRLGPIQLTAMYASPYNRVRGHIHIGYFF